jgi:hypothetical protein
MQLYSAANVEQLERVEAFGQPLPESISIDSQVRSRFAQLNNYSWTPASEIV